MKTTPIPPRVRNRLVAAARFRLAGAHRRSAGGARQRAIRALRLELLAAAKNIP